MQFTTITDERKTDSAVLDMAVAVLKKRLMGNGMGLHPKIGLLAEYRQGWSSAWGQGDPEDDDGEVSSLTVEWGPKGLDGYAPSYTLKKENFTTVSLYEANSTRFLGIFGHVRLDQNSQIFGYEDRTQHNPVDLMFFYDAAGTKRTRDPSFRLSGELVSTRAAQMWSRRTSYATIGHSLFRLSSTPVASAHNVSEYQNKISAFVSRAISAERSHFLAGLACGWRWAHIDGTSTSDLFEPNLIMRRFLRDITGEKELAYEEAQASIAKYFSAYTSSTNPSPSSGAQYKKVIAEGLISAGKTLDHYKAAVEEGSNLLYNAQTTFEKYKIAENFNDAVDVALMVRESWGGKTVSFQHSSPHASGLWDSLDSALANLPEHVAKAVAVINITKNGFGVSEFSENFGGCQIFNHVLASTNVGWGVTLRKDDISYLAHRRAKIESTLKGVDGAVSLYVIMPEKRS